MLVALSIIGKLGVSIGIECVIRVLIVELGSDVYMVSYVIVKVWRVVVLGVWPTLL